MSEVQYSWLEKAVPFTILLLSRRPQKHPLVTRFTTISAILSLSLNNRHGVHYPLILLQWTLRTWCPAPIPAPRTPFPSLLRAQGAVRSAGSIYLYHCFPWLSEPALHPLQTYPVFWAQGPQGLAHSYYPGDLPSPSPRVLMAWVLRLCVLFLSWGEVERLSSKQLPGKGSMADEALETLLVFKCP